ncbi:MAG: DNA methyltransferase [Epsilonproteobacteria bacterium]|nr:MAG: DNA methyltransferase [Campylobacterota bacterium]
MISNYILNINRLYQTGNAREHSYRGHLETLLNQIINDTDIVVTNEPARIVNVGAPDYSITKKNIPIGYIEAKDIGDKDLDGKKINKEQFDRYKNALDNLIITDYLDFLFYKNGELVQKISIAKVEDNKIISIDDNFSTFKNSILDFTSFVSQTITSPSKLSKLMAGKARLLEDVIEKAILSDVESDENNSLRNEMEVFKSTLIHDITPQSFADIYAQTIAYGLFTARLHDKTLENFSRQEAQYLIPKSNPFLRGLFNYIGGAECDDRLVWIIDSLAEIFLATNIEKLFVDYGKKGGMNDPIIHFYETFLGEYNPKLRKARGVWYTPQSVVNFIVRACDEVLKDEFGLEDGLTDDSKIKIKVDASDTIFTKDGKKAKNQKVEKEVHKVQILDPATGTGTFLAETIKFIKKDFFGSWSSYVEKDLIPRLNGFELLMASYAMAHLKLDLLLMETGYKPTNEKQQKRFNIFLTNSLEEHHESTGSLFSSYLANESKEADRIKKETPVMVVMGNPPYAVSSSNKSDWIQNLVKDYKKDLNERNIQPLSDDYIKFIRYGQHYIEKNGEGILAYISNNSFIDGIIHRQMRKSLLECFDKIYILDLHGNSKKKEVCPDGSKDENVFDIMQGVSINIFIKKKADSKKLADVYHCDFYGKRNEKYKLLIANSLNSIKWKKLDYKEPDFFFTDKDFSSEKDYLQSFKINEFFKIKAAGIKTHRDKVVIGFNENELENQVKEFKQDIDFNTNKIKQICYRPFDCRLLYYDTKLVERHRKEQIKHSFNQNYALLSGRQTKSNVLTHYFISNCLSEMKTAENTTGSYHFPLYLYQDENSLDNKRVPNINLEIVADIEKALNLKFVNEKEDNKTTFAPIDILDYIYAVLHSPKYRDKYKEFLKIDFPRVPYPSIDNFWQLVSLGEKIRALHLMEDNELNNRIIDISGDGDMMITNKLNKKDATIENDKVSLNLNEDVSIINIPLIAWEFYIGGYQPAQKWLKDRVGRELNRTDLKHYNKIINALIGTDKLMKEIDGVLEV